MMSRELPPTRRALLLRKLMGGVWVMSISAISVTLWDFTSRLMDVGFNPAGLGWRELVLTAILLLNGSLMCWMAYRGNRRNLMPPTWGLVTLVTLVWAALLLNRLA